MSTGDTPARPMIDWIEVEASEMSIHVTVPNSSHINGYNVYMDGTLTKTFGPVHILVFDNLHMKTTYRVSVSCKNEYGYGVRSREAIVRTMSQWAEPDAVMVTSNPQGDYSDQYTLTWKLTLQGIGKMPVIGYRFVLKKETGEKWPWNDVQGEEFDVYQDDTSYSFLHLEPDTEYSVDIKALNVMKKALPQKGLPASFKFRTA